MKETEMRELMSVRLEDTPLSNRTKGYLKGRDYRCVGDLYYGDWEKSTNVAKETKSLLAAMELPVQLDEIPFNWVPPVAQTQWFREILDRPLERFGIGRLSLRDMHLSGEYYVGSALGRREVKRSLRSNPRIPNWIVPYLRGMDLGWAPPAGMPQSVIEHLESLFRK